MLVHSLLHTLVSNSPRSAILPILLFLLAPSAARLSAAHPETETSSPCTERGFVFLDGRYIPPPYAIELKNGIVNINGHRLRTTEIKLPSGYEPHLPESKRWEQLHFDLQLYRTGDVVVLFRNREPMFLDETDQGARLIGILAGSSLPHCKDDELPESLERDADRVTWARLVSEFRPSPEFLTRANEHLARLEEIRQANAIRTARTVWADRIEFPVTAVAMVVVALAFGHLMSTKPYIGPNNTFMTDSPSPRQIVFRSLLLVGGLSLIDLVCTVVASDSGTMRELNPLGSQLMDRPLHLVAFKIATIAPAIGLLYRFHRSRIAQAASWWSCLVLTLVTARWLTFSSMFL